MFGRFHRSSTLSSLKQILNPEHLGQSILRFPSESGSCPNSPMTRPSYVVSGRWNLTPWRLLTPVNSTRANQARWTQCKISSVHELTNKGGARSVSLSLSITNKIIMNYVTFMQKETICISYYVYHAILHKACEFMPTKTVFWNKPYKIRSKDEFLRQLALSRHLQVHNRILCVF